MISWSMKERGGYEIERKSIKYIRYERYRVVGCLRVWEGITLNAHVIIYCQLNATEREIKKGCAEKFPRTGNFRNFFKKNNSKFIFFGENLNLLK